MKKILKLLILLNVFLCANLFASKSLYLSYSKIPTNIYKNQKLEALITEIQELLYELKNEQTKDQITKFSWNQKYS